MDNINVIDTSKQLRYVAVYNKLFKMITEGVFPKNSRLPSEPELAKSLGVSRSTLRQALSLLQDDGLIKNIRGKGNYITNENNTKKNGLEKVGHIIYKSIDHKIDNVEFEFKIEPPSDYFTKILGENSVATVVMDRWFNYNKETLAYTFTIIPIETISNFKLNLNNKEEILNFIEEDVYKECTTSTIHIKFSSTGNFVTKGHPISCQNQFFLIEESIYKNNKYPIAFNKHYIPMQYANIEINSDKL